VFIHAYHTGVLVPHVWPTEVANGLLVAQRRGRFLPGEPEQVLALLAGIDVTIAAEPVLTHMRTSLLAAGRFGLTAYGASYLSLAMREGLPLATNDRALQQAAGAAGVPLFGAALAAAGTAN